MAAKAQTRDARLRRVERLQHCERVVLFGEAIAILEHERQTKGATMKHNGVDMLNDDRVEHVYYPETRAGDPDVESAREDREERQRALAQAKSHESIELRTFAVLAGDHARHFGRGPIQRVLLDDAKSGKLRIIGSLTRTSGDMAERRRNPATVELDRDAAREWLQDEGDERMLKSAAAVWCRLINEGD